MEFTGLLYGRQGRERFEVHHFLVPNRYSSPNNCEVADSEEWNARVLNFQIENGVNQAGWADTHHLHPNVPSATDVTRRVSPF